jgi:hypothetical protein
VEVLSVNTGKPQPNPWKGISATGIDKCPAYGPVLVTASDPKGDAIKILSRPGHDGTSR